MKTALSMRNSFLIGFLIAGTAGALAATSSRETDLLDRPAEAPVIELRPGPSAAPDSRAAPQERTGNPL